MEPHANQHTIEASSSAVVRINTLKTKSNLNCTSIPNSHSAVNTLYLGNKNHSVNAIEENNRCLFLDPYKTHKKMCGRKVEFLDVTPAGR